MRMQWVVAVLCVSAAASAADIYKWTDAQGRVHYGNQPQTDTASKVEVNAPASQVERQQERNQELATNEKTKKQFEDCKRSKEQLLTYQNAASIVQKDALGGEKELDATQRAKLVQVTQQRIKDSCGAIADATNPSNPMPDAAPAQ